MFASAQLLHNWREQRPSDEDELDTSVTGEAGRVHCTAADLLLVSLCAVACDCCCLAFQMTPNEHIKGEVYL
jgi:hypothetical protein